MPTDECYRTTHSYGQDQTFRYHVTGGLSDRGIPPVHRVCTRTLSKTHFANVGAVDFSSVVLANPRSAFRRSIIADSIAAA